MFLLLRLLNRVLFCIYFWVSNVIVRIMSVQIAPPNVLFHQDFMRAMRISNPAMRAIADQMEQDEVVRWSASLARARVTRWGGMISTPDAVLQVGLMFTLPLLSLIILATCHCTCHLSLYLPPVILFFTYGCDSTSLINP